MKRALVVLLVTLAGGCICAGGQVVPPPPPPPPPVETDSVALIPNVVELTVGDTVQFCAFVRITEGQRWGIADNSYNDECQSVFTAWMASRAPVPSL